MTHGAPRRRRERHVQHRRLRPYDHLRTTGSSPQTNDDPHRIQLHRPNHTLTRPDDTCLSPRIPARPTGPAPLQAAALPLSGAGSDGPVRAMRPCIRNPVVC
jgi:hypothetical protein